jgi:hypothetical protein
MTINVAETIRKMMGWCPQERVVCDHNDVFFSENAYPTGTATYGENDKYMDIPVQMFDWIRISRYPEVILISSNGRNISLYPRNEHDFLMLKSIACEQLE